jgi:hypothetical protein
MPSVGAATIMRADMTDQSTVVLSGGLPISRFATRHAFTFIVVLGTAIPFLVPVLPAAPGFSLATAIELIAAIHVPMTLYLLFDPDIRSMMKRHPEALVAAPLAFFLIGVFLFIIPTVMLPANGNWPLTYGLLLISIWQNWHFGKQNVGVYALTRQAQKIGPMSMAERRMIVAGSVLGAVAAYFGATDLQMQRGPTAGFPLLLATIEALTPVATLAAFGLLAFSIAHVARNHRRLTLGSAVVLLLSANFFLPFYLVAVSLPNVLGITASAHGVQYVAFLMFHSANCRGRGRWMMAAFALSVAITSELYWFHFAVPEHWFGHQLGVLIGMDDHSAHVSTGLATGILLAHFWFDSVIWRLKNADSRAWVTRRYSFLFR